MAETKQVPGEVFTDRYGIVEVFSTHLEMGLENMNPEQAFEAAQNAARSYIRSYEFVPLTTKGGGKAQFHMRIK